MRERDITLMDAFLDTGIWQISDLETLNIVRRYKCVYSKSDITQPDGRTVLPSMMSNDPGNSDWTFPEEKPTGTQLRLWCDAIQHLTSAELVLPRSIGRYINPPHKKTGWYLSSNSSYLYKKSENGTFDTFQIAPEAQSSRRLQFVGCTPSSVPPLDIDNSKYASVKVNRSTKIVSVLTSMSVFVKPTQVRRPIPDILRSWHNPGL